MAALYIRLRAFLPCARNLNRTMNARLASSSAARRASALAAVLLPALAQAHPGHGPHSPADGVAHYLTSWEFSVPLLAASLLLAGLFRARRNSAKH
jgi:hypothetical protein